MADNDAVTLPGFGIFVGGGVQGNYLTLVLQHEYGHFLDYLYSPDLNLNGSSILNFYLLIGLPSILNSAATHIPDLGITHFDYWTEIRANQYAEMWFSDKYIKSYLFPTE